MVLGDEDVELGDEDVESGDEDFGDNVAWVAGWSAGVGADGVG